MKTCEECGAKEGDVPMYECDCANCRETKNERGICWECKGKRHYFLLGGVAHVCCQGCYKREIELPITTAKRRRTGSGTADYAMDYTFGVDTMQVRCKPCREAP